MSTPGDKLETAQQANLKGPEAFLSADERKQLGRMLGFPEDIPSKFKAWMQDYLSVNFPQIPITQISGFDKYLYKKGTALPADPRDGQVYTFLADTQNGISWRFQYNESSGSAYKWEFIGGAPAATSVDGDVSTTSAAFQDLGGPGITVPLAGDYLVQFGAEFNNNVLGRDTLMAVGYASTATDAERIVMEGVGGRVALSRATVTNAPTANSTLKCYYRIATEDCTGYWRSRWIMVQPIRVKKT